MPPKTRQQAPARAAYFREYRNNALPKKKKTIKQRFNMASVANTTGLLNFLLLVNDD